MTLAANPAAGSPQLDALPPLRLPEDLRLTPEQFERVCAANPEAVLELGADGQVMAMTPTGGETSRRNSELLFQLNTFASTSDSWLVFDSSGGFRLPDGSVLSPDASLVRLERWQVLTPQQRRGFPPLCPDLVVELASPSDEGPRGLTALRRKMTSYQANGARLGWLLLPDEQAVEVWPASGEPQRLEQPAVLDGGTEIPGLRLELAGIWAA
ncbi:MAG: Uma2 family endonuclease [Prochlorococcaceae cyanobacterium]